MFPFSLNLSTLEYHNQYYKRQAVTKYSVTQNAKDIFLDINKILYIQSNVIPAYTRVSNIYFVTFPSN
jgi:hypothetical protein